MSNTEAIPCTQWEEQYPIDSNEGNALVQYDMEPPTKKRRAEWI